MARWRVAVRRDWSRAWRRPYTVGRALLHGTLIVGILDILDAFIFFGLRGVKTDQASCRASRQASWAVPRIRAARRQRALGLALHFVIAFGVVAVYLVATRVAPALNRRRLIYGLLYGIVVYVVMNFVIVPMSHAALGSGPTPLVVRANGILIHMLGVGLPAALVAARVAQQAACVSGSEIVNGRPFTAVRHRFTHITALGL